MAAAVHVAAASRGVDAMRRVKRAQDVRAPIDLCLRWRNMHAVWPISERPGRTSRELELMCAEHAPLPSPDNRRRFPMKRPWRERAVPVCVLLLPPSGLLALLLPTFASL